MSDEQTDLKSVHPRRRRRRKKKQARAQAGDASTKTPSTLPLASLRKRLSALARSPHLTSPPIRP